MLGLIFVKYIRDTFATRLADLIVRLTNPADAYFFHNAGPGDIDAELEDRDYCTKVNAFWVTEPARSESMRDASKQPDIGKRIDEALTLIELENPSSKAFWTSDMPALGWLTTLPDQIASSLHFNPA